MKKLSVVGIGPGNEVYSSIEARETLEGSDLIIGYKKYVELVEEYLPDKEYLYTGMTKEVDRCKMALEKACEGLSIEEQERLYDDYEAFKSEWDKKCNEMMAANPALTWADIEEEIGSSQWAGPMGCKNPYRPAGLYECMLQRVCPYSLRGFLYYQGESDDHKPRMYYKLFTRLIRQWREDFLDEELPFLLVQLPMHQYQGDPDYKHWPVVREAQMDAYKTIKNTGIAVIIDRGEFNVSQNAEVRIFRNNIVCITANGTIYKLIVVGVDFN